MFEANERLEMYLERERGKESRSPDKMQRKGKIYTCKGVRMKGGIYFDLDWWFCCIVVGDDSFVCNFFFLIFW